MKSIRFWAVALLLLAGVAANAQFRFGLKAGIDVNSLHFNSDVFDDDNRAGFTGGAMVEFTVPVIGVGFDASVMYVRRNARFMATLDDGTSESFTNNRDYIEIPINLKYKISIPVVSKILTPFLTTGPSFAFLTSSSIVDDMRNKKTDIAWNFGFGLQFINHIQLAASYGLGISKSITGVEGADINGKNRYWTITAAYLF